MKTALRIALNIAAMLFLFACSLPWIMIGGYLFSYWRRIQTTDVYYVDFPYFSYGLVTMAIGLFCLGITLHGVWKWDFKKPVLLLVPLLALIAAVELPEAQPYIGGYVADTNYLGSIQTFFNIWYENHRTFPATRAEYEEAFVSGHAVWQNRLAKEVSLYRQRGNPVPYEIVIETGAKGPHITDVATRPGVVYYSVSLNRQEFWATMSGLNSNLAESATIHRDGVQRPDNEKPEVIHVFGPNLKFREKKHAPENKVERSPSN